MIIIEATSKENNKAIHDILDTCNENAGYNLIGISLSYIEQNSETGLLWLDYDLLLNNSFKNEYKEINEAYIRSKVDEGLVIPKTLTEKELITKKYVTNE